MIVNIRSRSRAAVPIPNVAGGTHEILKWEEFGVSYVRLEVLTVMNIEIADIVLCSLVDWY